MQLELEKTLNNFGKTLIDSLEIENKEDLKEKLKKVLYEQKQQNKSKKYKSEYNDMIKFNQNNKGYEDYILFVSEIFSPDMENECSNYINLLNKRYEFNNSKLNGKYIDDNKNNDLINEIFSKRNLDLLLVSAPNIETRLESQKVQSEINMYNHLKKNDPLLALELLVSHKKRLNKTFKKEMLTRFSEAFAKRENINPDKSAISSFISAKQENSNDNILNGMYIRKKITPLGTLPVKSLILQANNAIEKFKNLRIKEADILIAASNKKINEDIIQPAKDKQSFIERIRKIGSTLFIALAVTTASFMPIKTNIHAEDEILSQMNSQAKIQREVEVEILSNHFNSYEIKDGDTLYKIARERLSVSNPTSTDKEVAMTVENIINDNPWLKENPDKITVGKKVKIRNNS